MPRVKIKPAAANDLAEIWSYVSENSSEEQADRLIDKLDAQATLLAEAPKIGRLRPNLIGRVAVQLRDRQIYHLLPPRRKWH